MRAAAGCLAVALLSGCSTAAVPPPAGGPGTEHKPLVLTTFTVLADLVRNVAGDRVRVESITKVGAEIHGYEPTPSDLKTAAGADLILDNGLGLERWFERFVAAVDAPHHVLSDGIEPVNIQVGDYEGLPNPHAWMSPAGAMIYVDNTVEALTGLDPAGASYYEANGAALKARLEELLQEFTQSFADTGSPRVLATCEGAFSYLARDAGLQEAYLWPVNSDAEGSPGQIKALISLVREHSVPTVFCESTVNPAAQEQVARTTGAVLRTPLYVDSLSGPDGPVPTFLDLLEYDLTLIKEGLSP